MDGMNKPECDLKKYKLTSTMTRYILLFSLFLLAFGAQAQPSEGVVIYTRKTDWVKLSARLSYLSQEQKDRIANRDRNDEENKEKMKLVFSPSASMYSFESESGESETGRYTWRNPDLFYYRDFDKEQQIDVEETLGKTYIVEDSLRLPKWKIGNQIREIAGHMCLDASTFDPVKQHAIKAWFAQDIAAQAGPEKYCGLPGLILELDIDEGVIVVEAKTVSLKSVVAELKPPKAKKGKKVDEKGFATLIKNHIAEQIKEQQNPYWTIRY